MDNTSSEKIAEALKLLEEAAKQKKDELKTVMADKYVHLKNMIVEGEGSLKKTLTAAEEQALKAAIHAKEVSVAKAKELADHVDKSVHSNPWPFIAGTAVVSLLLGAILGRDRK